MTATDITTEAPPDLTPDDPRLVGVTFPYTAYVLDHVEKAAPTIRVVRLIAYDLADPGCRTKTVVFRELGDPGARGRRTRCSTQMVFLSVDEAREHIRTLMEAAVIDLTTQLVRTTTSIVEHLSAARQWLLDNPKKK